MPVAINAVYEEGKLRPLEPLMLAEHTVVRLSLETAADDTVRQEWLAQGERSLMRTWDNDADEIYNALLTE